MNIPLDASGLNFRAGLGRAAHVFYSVKQLKQHFGPGSGKKKFAGFKISTHARPVRFVSGPGRAGLKMFRYSLPFVLRERAKRGGLSPAFFWDRA
jgi:hypothetical protein